MTQTTNSAPTPSSTFGQRFRDLGSLRRSTDRRVLAGVGEGLSRHFDIDPIIVRVAFVALTFFGGAGIILYLALWLTVPEDNRAQSLVSGRLNRDPQSWVTAGLAIGGVLAAVALLGSISWAVPHPFPFLLIVLFIALALVAVTRRRDSRWSPPVDAGTTTPAAPTTAATPMTPAPMTASSPTATPAPSAATPGAAEPFAGERSVDTTTAMTIVVPPGLAAEPTSDTATTQAWWQRGDIPPTDPIPPVAAYPPPPPPKRQRSHLFGLTMATIALAIAGLWTFDVTTSYDLNPSVYPGTALGIIAVGLIAGTWWGRSRGLIAMGVLASLLTAGAAFVGPGPYGDVVASPVLASQLHPTYTLGAGQLTLHLEQISDVEQLNGRAVSLNARFGHVVVIIPSSVAATVDATVDHGEIDGALGQQDLDRGGEHVVMAPIADGRPTMTIHVHLRFGQIQIERATCPGAPFPAPGESINQWNGDSNVAAACN